MTTVPLSITAPVPVTMRAFTTAKYRGSPPAPRAAYDEPISTATHRPAQTTEKFGNLNRFATLHLTGNDCHPRLVLSAGRKRLMLMASESKIKETRKQLRRHHRKFRRKNTMPEVLR